MGKIGAVRRVVLIADRGLLNLDNLAHLQQIKTGGKQGRPPEFILALPGRRYAESAAAGAARQAPSAVRG